MGLCVFLVSLALTGRAAAESKKEQAEVHYEQGRAYYKAGAFDLAIQEFLDGYNLFPRAGVLFNIARGYEELKDKNKAIEFYQKYVDLGAQATASTEARARLVALERQVKEEEERKKAEAAERERQASSPPPAAMPPPVVTAPAAPEKAAEAVPPTAVPSGTGAAPEGAVTVTAPGAASSNRPRALKVAALITGGAGIVLVGVGGFFLLRGSNLRDDINSEVARTDAWTAALSSKDADRKTANTIGASSLVAGGVVVAGGAILYAIGAHNTSQEAPSVSATARLTPVVGPNGGALLLTARF
jgi:tetratricopeptide (TPR) repeat protein